MQVYIELVLLDNFIIDYILLYVTGKTLGAQAQRVRLIAGAVFGAAFAVVMPLVSLRELPLFVLKLIAGLLIAAFAFYRKRKKAKLLLSYVVFMAYTFLVGGLIVGFIMLFNGDIYSAAVLSYQLSVPIGVIAAAAFTAALLLLKLVKYIDRKKNIYPFKRRIELHYRGKTLHDYGFIDSGNCVYDDSGKPVTVVSLSAASRLLDGEQLKDILTGGESCKAKKKHYVSPSGRDSTMYLVKIDKLLIYSDRQTNTIEDIHIGIVPIGFSGIDGCSALLHSALISGDAADKT